MVLPLIVAQVQIGPPPPSLPFASSSFSFVFFFPAVEWSQFWFGAAVDVLPSIGLSLKKGEKKRMKE